ncbi:MAG: DNRLRE domain-containing protein [Gammaproteobacteria bacterium]|nr:DNRLRE domain-containing protein [Gammaproteobacteria bacterium]
MTSNHDRVRASFRSTGYILLPVVLLIAILAAVIVLLARENVSSIMVGSREAQVNTASLVAEAGLRHAIWKASSTGTCTGYTDLVDVPFGEHLYSASYSKISGSPVAITASGVLASGATRQVSIAQQTIFELPTTLLLQPDSEGKDSYIIDDLPNDNFGKQSALYTDSEAGGSGPMRTLIQFDLSSIPAPATIQFAELQLYLSLNNGSETDVVEAHRLTRDWIEGTGGSGVSWNSYDGVSNWSTPGGDYAPEIAGSFVAAGTGWKTMDLSALAQDWVAGTVANYGVLLLSDPASGNKSKKYISSDNPDPALRPKLIVSYVCECGTGTAGTLVQQPAASGTDTSLRNHVGNEGTTNYGNDSELRVSTNGGRSLLKFNLSTIPAEALIESAELELHFNDADSISSANFSIHEVTGDWRETEATWNEYQSGENWISPGGDHNPTAIDTTMIGSTPNTKYTWDATDLVAAWVSGTTINNGLLLRVSSGGGSVTNARFASSDASTAAKHPKLTVNYRCPCGADCTPVASGGTYCEADFAANTKSFDFDWGPDTGDITGIDFLPEGTVVNGVTIPAGGGWIKTDRNKKEFFITDESGTPLTDFPTGIDDPRGIAYVEAGTWTGHLAVADKSNDTIHFLDLDGIIKAAFSTLLFAKDPFGLSFIGETSSHVYEDHLAISSADGNGTVYIVDQSGTLKNSIDVDSYAPRPQGLAHLASDDKFMVADKDGLISIIDFGGTAINQYDTITWGLKKLQGVTIHPGTCAHVVIDKIFSLVAGLSLRQTPGGGTPRLLMAVGNASDLSDQELAKKTLFEFWGHKVSIIDDQAPANDYDAAILVNDVVFVGEDTSANKIASKLTDAPIGVVYEEVNLSDEFGLSTSISWTSGTTIDIDDTDHHVTLPFALGPLDILASVADLAYMTGTLAPDLRVLGSTAAGAMLATLEAGATMFNSLPAAGRRVQVPWGESNFDVANLSADSETMLKRSLEWGVQPPPRCDADFAANNLVSDFPWGAGTGDLHGIDFVPAGLVVNSVSIPSGGGWVMSDKSKDRFFVTDLAGNQLTDFPVIAENSQGVALIDAGSWIHHFAVAGVDLDGKDRIYYLNLDGGIEWSFSIQDITTNPLGLGDIGVTASGLYVNHLAISSDKNPSGGGTATVYIIDQTGMVVKTIDIEAHAPTPQGVSHLRGADKLLITDKNGLVSIVDFDGNLLHQYSALFFGLDGLTELNDVAINPLTCEHVLVDKDLKKISTLNRDTGSGSGPSYVEMNLPWNAIGENAWEMKNLGVYGIPANAVVEVAVVNDDGGKELWGGVRAMGSSLERRLQLHEAGGGGVDAMVLHVQTDSAGRIEHYTEDADKLSFVLLGYWAESTYVENWQVFKAGANNSWESHGLSAYGVAGGDVAEFLLVNNDGFSEHSAGVRTDGSGLDRRFDLHQAQDGGDEGATLFSVAGSDAAATVELYAADDASIDFYLLGHWSTPPGTYSEAFEDLGTPTANEVWENTDLSPHGVPAHAIARIALTNKQIDKEVFLGVRSVGSGMMRLLELHQSQSLSGGEDLATMQVRADAGGQIQWYEKDILLNHEFYLLGWWELL